MRVHTRRSGFGRTIRDRSEPGALQVLPAGLSPGALVVLRDCRWRVERTRPAGECAVLWLQGVEPRNHGVRRAVITPFDRPRPVVRRHDPRVVTPRRWHLALRTLVASKTAPDVPDVVVGARIEVLPYQLEPAVLLLSNRAPRLLLADAVGLGKTVQAAIVIAEMCRRDARVRILVVVPAGLRDQWREELLTRFSVAARVMDGPTLAALQRGMPVDANAWHLPGVSLVSIDFLKRADVVRGLHGTIWDLLVVDEAHLLTTGTDRLQAVRRLAEAARRVLLLTATPHGGDATSYADLCRIGQLRNGQPDDLVVLGRSREAAGLEQVGRRTCLLRVTPSEAERRLHAVLSRYTSRIWRRPEDEGARLAMIVLTRRALSSPWALMRSARARLRCLHPDDTAVQHRLPLLEDEPEGDPRDRLPLEVLAARGLGSVALERSWLRFLLRHCGPAVRADSKRRCLERLVRRTREPIVIFTEYRDTLHYLARALSRTAAVSIVHGGLSRTDRREALAAFREHRTRVLLATDTAAEGLNLHHGCRTVVQCELPWSPTRVEQRAGRIDRLGQRGIPHLLLLVGRGTAEEHILVRLVARYQAIASAMAHEPGAGPCPPALMELAEAIIAGGTSSTLWGTAPVTPRPSQATTTHPMLVARAKAVADVLRTARRLAPAPAISAAVSAEIGRRSPWVTRSRSRGVPTALSSAMGDVESRPGAVFVVVSDLHAADGRLLQRDVASVRVKGTVTPGASRSSTRRATADLRARFEREALASAARRLARSEIAGRASATLGARRFREREECLVRRLRQRRAPTQLGLFPPTHHRAPGNAAQPADVLPTCIPTECDLSPEVRRVWVALIHLGR